MSLSQENKEKIKFIIDDWLEDRLKDNFIINPWYHKGKQIFYNGLPKYNIYYHAYSDLGVDFRKRSSIYNTPVFSTELSSVTYEYRIFSNLIDFTEKIETLADVYQEDFSFLRFTLSIPRNFEVDESKWPKAKEQLTELLKQQYYDENKCLFFKKEEIETSQKRKDEIGSIKKIRVNRLNGTLLTKSPENIFVYDIKTFKLEYAEEDSFEVFYCYNMESNIKSPLVKLATKENKEKSWQELMESFDPL
jgi:hypothetical protein